MCRAFSTLATTIPFVQASTSMKRLDGERARSDLGVADLHAPLDGLTDLDLLVHPREHRPEVEPLVRDRGVVELDLLREPSELGEQLRGDLDVVEPPVAVGQPGPAPSTGCRRSAL